MRVKLITTDRFSDNFELEGRINSWISEAESGAITAIKTSKFKVLSISISIGLQGNATATILYEGDQR